MGQETPAPTESRQEKEGCSISPGTRHTAAQGDSVESIAHAAGHVWQTLWDHPENAALRERRRSPHVLHPGDVVFVPPLKLRTETLATGKTHTFRRRGVPSRLVVRFLLNGQPRANAEYTVVIDGKERTGRTDGDGWLRESVAPQACKAEVRFPRQAQETPDGEEAPGGDEKGAPPQDIYQLDLRHLDPSSEISGAQGRLLMLGYDVDAIDGNMNDKTRSALKAFQADNGLDVTGELDDATQAKLAEFTDG